MKLGILGGAFDPIHSGHIRLAESAAKEHGLDRLILLPTGISPHKAALSAVKEHRFKLVEIAAESLREELDIPVIVDDREFHTDTPNYTYVTLVGFQEDYPGDELFFIMGGDSIECFHKWVKPEVISSQAVILAGRRKETDEDRIRELIKKYAEIYHADVRLVGSPETDISSTKLREDLKNLPYNVFPSYEALLKAREYSGAVNEILLFMSSEALKYIYENRVYEGIHNGH